MHRNQRRNATDDHEAQHQHQQPAQGSVPYRLKRHPRELSYIRADGAPISTEQNAAATMKGSRGGDGPEASESPVARRHPNNHRERPCPKCLQLSRNVSRNAHVVATTHSEASIPRVRQSERRALRALTCLNCRLFREAEEGTRTPDLPLQDDRRSSVRESRGVLETAPAQRRFLLLS
jgi:hypothetical protein